MADWKNIMGYCLLLFAVASLASAASNQCKPNNKGGCDQANVLLNRCKGQCVLEKGNCTCRSNNLNVPGANNEESQEVIEFLGTSQGGCYSTRDGCRNEGCGGGGGCVNFGKVPKNDCRCVLPSRSNTTSAGNGAARPGSGK